MHFGQFLLLKKTVTPAQILQALDEQRHSLPFIGRIAIEQNILSVSQVLEILEVQQAMGPTAKKFGEIAIMMGAMTRGEFQRIREYQREAALPIGEILVRNDCITRKKMIALLKEFLALRKSEPPAELEAMAKIAASDSTAGSQH